MKKCRREGGRGGLRHGGFSYEKWLAGLIAGRSFVTTGPMLFMNVTETEVKATVLGDEPVHAVEVIVNGDIVETLRPATTRNAEGAWESDIAWPRPAALKAAGTHWIALRAWEQRGSRWRFAHSAPHWTEVAGKPLKPRKREIEYLLQRAKDSLATSEKLLSPAARAEYEAAIRRYQEIAATAAP